MSHKDLYGILGVERGASAAEIKRAYRTLAKKYHPDQNKDDKEALARFKEIQQAYAVLSDEERRRNYDRHGHAGPIPDGAWQQGPGGQRVYRWQSTNGGPVDFDPSDLEDLFDFSGAAGGGFADFFRQATQGAPGGRATRGRHAVATPPVQADVEHAADIDFLQAVAGTSLHLAVEVPGAGTERIEVRIPAGVTDGQRVRVKGKGQPTGRGRGDLYIRCRIRPHAYFRRAGDDIYLDLPLSITEAALGARVTIPTVDGPTVLTVPAGTASGKRLRLTGRGVRNARTGRRGDQYAVVQIVPPGALNDEQRTLLQGLADSGLSDPRADLWTDMS
jgi:DnaJ-class molecular chaperone